MYFQLPKTHINDPVNYTQECLIIRDFIISLLGKKPQNPFLLLSITLNYEEFMVDEKGKITLKKRLWTSLLFVF